MLTIVALLQAVSPEPRRLYGVWKPTWDWAVFGPYVNRNHFAGYLVMAGALALGFALDALARLRAEWAQGAAASCCSGRPRAGAPALGRDRDGDRRRPRRLAVAGRGAAPSPSRRSRCRSPRPAARRTALVAGAARGDSASSWIGLGGVISAFEMRGIQGSRLDLWRDMLPMVTHFPLFGDGWNAFATAYPWYQTVWKTDWIGEAHNDYLQALLDGGPVGLLLVAGLFLVALRGALARARHSPVELGLFGALAGFAFHELVDFNGQIPANAATFVALAALAARPRARPPGGGLDSGARHP